MPKPKQPAPPIEFENLEKLYKLWSNSQAGLVAYRASLQHAQTKSKQEYMDFVAPLHAAHSLAYPVIQLWVWREYFSQQKKPYADTIFFDEYIKQTGLLGLHMYFAMGLIDKKKDKGKFHAKVLDFIELVKMARAEADIPSPGVYEQQCKSFEGYKTAEYAGLRRAFYKTLQDGARCKETAQFYQLFFNASFPEEGRLKDAIALLRDNGMPQMITEIPQDVLNKISPMIQLMCKSKSDLSMPLAGRDESPVLAHMVLAAAPVADGSGPSKKVADGISAQVQKFELLSKKRA